MGISIGLVGLGAFGSAFADLFRSHPLVDRIALCDRETERMEKFAQKDSWGKKFNRRDIYTSLDEICTSDLDALVVITQPWLHAPQCIQAMEAGKHVYSAVPIISIPDGDETLDWCDKIINTSKKTGMSYMLGETTFFHPEAMFCRKKASEGAFGDFVYAEGEYFHDVDSGCSLRKVIAAREASASGKEWAEKIKLEYRKRGIKSGPMHYPTHSTSGPVFVMKAHALKVTAYGYANQNNDPFFQDDAFSNETAVFKMSNGATVRICEFREIAGAIAGSETFRILGTSGSYAENRWMENGRNLPLTAKPLKTVNLTNEEMRDPLPPEVVKEFLSVYNEGKPADQQNADFVPQGHSGSHPYLVHEFVDAVAHNRQPVINAWEASRYTAMGIMAHKSALKDGKTLNIPDWGNAPQ
jgi:predicted dehydrogenase